MVISSGDCDGGPTDAKVNWSDLWRASVRAVMAFVRPGTAVAQLSVAITSPALHRPVVKNGACVAVTSRDGDGCPTFAQVDRGTGLVCVCRPAIAQLPVTIPSPALDGSIVQDGAGEPRSSIDRSNAAAQMVHLSLRIGGGGNFNGFALRMS